MAQLMLGAGIQRAAAVGVDDDGRKRVLADDRIAIGVCARPNGRIAVVRSAAVMEIMSARASAETDIVIEDCDRGKAYRERGRGRRSDILDLA
jgi:hypothetical protein